MQLKINNLKFLTKIKHLSLSILILFSYTLKAQEIIEDKKEEKVKEKYVVNKDGRIKIDGVAAVVGDFVILDSDIDRQIQQSEAAQISTKDLTRCQFIGQLLENKLYVFQAIRDSIIVNDAQIRSITSQQLNSLADQIGSKERLVAYYKKRSFEELEIDTYEINKNNSLARQMQEKVLDPVEITPEEVRQYYNAIPKDERPIIGTELKIAQIVIIPKTTEEEKQKVIRKLNEFRTDVLKNGGSFASKAALYSDDKGSKSAGGKLPPMNKKNPRMVKEFREIAFALEEGEISEPFETDFGFHIIWLEKIRGQEYDVRHILLRPEIPQAEIDRAKALAESTKAKIEAGDISFAEAAKEISDEKETKFEGGLLLNTQTGEYTFDLTNMQPELYSQIQDLKDNTISEVIQDSDPLNEIRFKILTVTDRVDEHEADFARDYVKIKNFALGDKKLKTISKWQKQKILETYVKLNGEHRKCKFEGNWMKTEN